MPLLEMQMQTDNSIKSKGFKKWHPAIIGPLVGSIAGIYLLTIKMENIPSVIIYCVSGITHILGGLFAQSEIQLILLVPVTVGFCAFVGGLAGFLVQILNTDL
jgi:hypothetical protein